MATRILREVAMAFQERPYTLILLSPQFKVPPDAEKEVAIMAWPLPTQGELEALVEQTLRDLPPAYNRLNGARDRLVRGVSGLTEVEASAVLGLAAITFNCLDERAIRLVLDVARMIVPATRTNLEQVRALREWAASRAIPASSPDPSEKGRRSGLQLCPGWPVVGRRDAPRGQRPQETCQAAFPASPSRPAAGADAPYRRQAPRENGVYGRLIGPIYQPAAKVAAA